MHTVGPGVWRKNRKTWKTKTHTVGHEIWLDTLKMWKMRNEHHRTWNMAKMNK